MEVNEYTILFEKSATGWSAYVPDLPGVVAAAASRDECRELMSGAIEMHIEGMREDGHPIPPPTIFAEVARAA